MVAMTSRLKMLQVVAKAKTRALCNLGFPKLKSISSLKFLSMTKEMARTSRLTMVLICHLWVTIDKRQAHHSRIKLKTSIASSLQLTIREVAHLTKEFTDQEIITSLSLRMWHSKRV